MVGWLENEFLKKTPSPKFELESLLGTFDFGVCQQRQREAKYKVKEETLRTERRIKKKWIVKDNMKSRASTT